MLGRLLLAIAAALLSAPGVICGNEPISQPIELSAIITENDPLTVTFEIRNVSTKPAWIFPDAFGYMRAGYALMPSDPAKVGIGGIHDGGRRVRSKKYARELISDGKHVVKLAPGDVLTYAVDIRRIVARLRDRNNQSPGLKRLRLSVVNLVLGVEPASAEENEFLYGVKFDAPALELNRTWESLDLLLNHDQSTASGLQDLPYWPGTRNVP